LNLRIRIRGFDPTLQSVASVRFIPEDLKNNSTLLVLSFGRGCRNFCFKVRKYKNKWLNKSLIMQQSLYRNSFLHRRTCGQQKYFDFHDFTFFCFKQMRKNELVRRAEFAWHLVQLRYNDCCIIKLLFSHLFQYFLTLNRNSNILFQKTRHFACSAHQLQ
jgi:hypothetical protein